MVGRDNPRVVTESGVRDLLSDSETLRRAGYETGDTVPLFAFNVSAITDLNTSSSSFKFANNYISGIHPRFDELFPNSQMRANFQCQINPDSGETGTAKIVNSSDKEDIAVVSASSAGDYSSGWVNYTPATTDDTVEITTKIKTEPGSNNSKFNRGSYFAGVQL
jgi:hypothetical protein